MGASTDAPSKKDFACRSSGTVVPTPKECPVTQQNLNAKPAAKC